MLYFLVTLPVILTEEIAGPMVTMRITEYRQSGSYQLESYVVHVVQ
jgi:hypothetical protein